MKVSVITPSTVAAVMREPAAWSILTGKAAKNPPAGRTAAGTRRANVSLRESEVFALRRKRGKPERAVQKAVLRWLRANGCLVTVTDAGAAYRAGAFSGDAVPAGWPDVTGLLPGGRFIGVECKAPKGRQSPAQKTMEQEIRNRNGIYIVARSIEDVQNGIANADRQSAEEQH